MEEFDFASVSSSDTSAVIDAVLKFIKRAETHLGNIVHNHPASPKSKEPQVIADSSLLDSTVNYIGTFMESDLVGELKKDLDKMKFTPMSNKSNSPDIALFGDYPYAFNQATKDLKPSPIAQDSTLFKVMDKVNGKLGSNFNSILINKYRDLNVSLGWHKDDEEVIDQTVAIATLSIGAARRFEISDSKVDYKITQLYRRDLVDNSVLIMKPGLQDSHFHRICVGRKGRSTERGIRYSLTFRRLRAPLHTAHAANSPAKTLPAPDSPVATVSNSQTVINEAVSEDITHSLENHHSPSSHSNCVNTIVYGSSLTKDLKCDLLSKRGKSFRVFTRGGARVQTVIKMVKDSVDKGEVCPSCVENVFLVVGGNDVQNIRAESSLETLKSSYKELFDCINSKLPVVRINIISLIPRECDYLHLQRMFYINEFLKEICSNDNSNLFFVPMFTKYLLYKDIYHKSKQVYLNPKLFHRDRVHFSNIGTSVLAKTLIAVANFPRY